MKKNLLYSPIIISNSFGVFKTCAAHFEPIRRNFTEKLDLRKFFQQRIKRMTSNQGIIKGAGGSRVGGSRVVLSGARSLEEEEINLLKSFVETLRNSPNKTKVNVGYK